MKQFIFLAVMVLAGVYDLTHQDPRVSMGFIGTTAAIIGGIAAGAGAAGSIASAKISSNAAKDAAKTIAKGQENLSDITQAAVLQGQDEITEATKGLQQSGENIAGMYDQFTAPGGQSIEQLQALTGEDGQLGEKFSFTGKDLIDDPGYQEALMRGQQAIERAAAAKGGLYGTNTLKRLADWSTGTANQYFNDAFTRAKTTFDTNRQGVLNRAGILQNLAQLALGGTQAKAGALGETATQVNRNLIERANLGLRGADVIGNAQANSANATAAGQVSSANSWTNALKNGTAALQDFLAKRNFGGGGSTSGPDGLPVVNPNSTFTSRPVYVA